jgi:hypothetical protein
LARHQTESHKRNIGIAVSQSWRRRYRKGGSITIRLNDAEYFQVLEDAENARLSTAEYVKNILTLCRQMELLKDTRTPE